MNNEVKVTKACIQIRWKVLHTQLLPIINQEELVESLTCALEELKKDGYKCCRNNYGDPYLSTNPTPKDEIPTETWISLYLQTTCITLVKGCDIQKKLDE